MRILTSLLPNPLYINILQNHTTMNRMRKLILVYYYHPNCRFYSDFAIFSQSSPESHIAFSCHVSPNLSLSLSFRSGHFRRVLVRQCVNVSQLCFSDVSFMLISGLRAPTIKNITIEVMLCPLQCIMSGSMGCCYVSLLVVLTLITLLRWCFPSFFPVKLQ